MDPSRHGMMNGFDYVAAMIVAGAAMTRGIKSRGGSNRGFERASAANSVSGGVSTLARDGCFARILATGAESMRRTVAGLWAEARTALHGDNPPLILRK